MAPLWILALALFAGATSASRDNRIMGGNPTIIENYPSLAQVDFRGVFTYMWTQSCGANILTSRYLLSAAHCFEGPLYSTQLRRVRVGATYRNIYGTILYVDQVVNHPSYGTLGMDGDIAVVRLSTAIEYGPRVQQGTIVAQGTQIPDNVAAVHAGWGATSHGGSFPSTVRDVTVFTINNRLCMERYLSLPEPHVVTENMICAGLLNVGGRDACQGDSGGPLYVGTVIVGIVSWGHTCGNETFPGVNAAVSSYTNWIVSQAV